MNKKWIFIRGLTRGTFHWGEFADDFKKACPDDVIEFLEIPGNGFSFQEITPVDPLLLVELLRSRSTFVQSKEKIHLCGISLGGMIALKWAEIYPDEVESVSVINCSLMQFSSFYERLKPNLYFKMIKTLFNRDPHFREGLVLEITSNRSDKQLKYLQSFGTFAALHPMKKYNFFRQLVLANRIKIDRLDGNKITVYCSKEDRLVNYHCSLKLAAHFNSCLLIHPTAGHDLPLDEPEWLIKHLR